MARADLLVRLVQSGVKGDKNSFKKIVEAIIAEERSKKHNVLASRLEEALQNISQVDSSVNNKHIVEQRSVNLFQL